MRDGCALTDPILCQLASGMPLGMEKASELFYWPIPHDNPRLRHRVICGNQPAQPECLALHPEDYAATAIARLRVAALKGCAVEDAVFESYRAVDRKRPAWRTTILVHNKVT